MYRIAFILGLLVTPALAEAITHDEAVKLGSLGEKAKSDIQKHLESKNLKVNLIELIWSCSFQNVVCTASAKLKFTGHALVVSPGGNTQVAECEATATPEETDAASSCRVFAQNLKFNERECAVAAQYFNICAKSLDENDGECIPADVSHKWLRWGDNSTLAIELRHHLPYSRLTSDQGTFDIMCKNVCYEKMTAQMALKKFCRRPAPAGYDEIVIQEAEAAMLRHYSRGEISAADALRLAAPVARVLKPVRTKP
ncbi:hypothetical protein [Bradyrhizobium lupini]|uniref:hypothetical protein n=1 Tax=Rhizobium lupini TaxID=136996 RepID=UPI0034C69D18